MILISILTFSIALDDQGGNIYSWVEYPIIITGVVVAILTSFLWFKSFRKNRNTTSVFFALLPFVLTVVHFLLYYQTQAKINRDYFLFATNPDEHAHQFKYYFRSDGTLKTHGLFFWSEGNDFQNFTMKGDTIFLDTILFATGIQSKIYLKTIETNSRGEQIKLLIPLDNIINPLTL